jgi:hypothetical protein
MELHRLLGILMPDRMKGTHEINPYVEFFPQLSSEALLQGFSRFAFSTRKFPESCQVNARLAPRDQVTAFPAD